MSARQKRGEPVNLNTAARQELEEALGEECARIVMKYRDEYGMIESFEGLEGMSGFSTEMMESLRRGGTIAQP
jgi:DNA uptake protein ComE-like DNA-binding protein